MVDIPGLEIPPHSLYVMVGVIALLVTASIVCLVLQKQQPGEDYTELKQRIQSWWWMIGLLFGVLVLSRNTAIIFIASLSFLALKEFLSIVPTRQADRRILFLAYLSIPLQYYWIAINWYGMFLIFIPVYVFLVLPMRAVMIGETRGFIKSSGIIYWAVMLTVFCISHIASLLNFPEKNVAAGNIGLVLFLVFITQFNDVSQYVWGKSFGKRKIIPKVSPNKTWGGFLGGLGTAAVCAALLAPLLTPMSIAQGAAAGVLIGFSGFIGDVVISSVKRDLQIKDSGTLIPGHGGILDRIDSLIYTAPVFFHYLKYIHY